jgi:hypothetical protein
MRESAVLTTAMSSISIAVATQTTRSVQRLAVMSVVLQFRGTLESFSAGRRARHRANRTSQVVTAPVRVR